MAIHSLCGGIFWLAYLAGFLVLKFSIVLPTYNRANMLPSALETLQFQTFKDFEVLIIDDGSTDRTPEIIGKWTIDPRFKYHRLPKNIGNMACRNLALEMAVGEWITNIDSDDFWLPNRLERFNAFIGANPGAEFVFSNGYLLRFDRIVGHAFPPDMPLMDGRVPGHYAVGMDDLPYLTTNLAIKRSLYQKYGNYRDDMMILDNELYARMLRDGVQVGIIRESLALRRVHDGQVTHNWIEEYPEAIEALTVSGVSSAVFLAKQKKLILDIAGYFLKNLQPKESRSFLVGKLGASGKRTSIYWKTFTPVWLLKALKGLRAAYLKLRYHTFWASKDFQHAYFRIQHLLVEEKNRMAL